VGVFHRDFEVDGLDTILVVTDGQSDRQTDRQIHCRRKDSASIASRG